MAMQRRMVRSDQQAISLKKAFEIYISEKKSENSSSVTIRLSTDSFKRWSKFLGEEHD